MILTCIIFAVLGILFYKWGNRNINYFKDRGVKNMDTYFIFGSTTGFLFKRYHANEFFKYMYNCHPEEKIIGFFEFTTPKYLLRDAETIKQLSIKDFDHFEDHRLFVGDDLDELFGNGLLLMKGQKWRDMRATLSPAFTGSKMRSMFELVKDCAQEMTEHFKNKQSNGDPLNFEMKDLFTKYTNDVIASAAFGLKINSFENPQNTFYINGKKMLDLNTVKTIVKILSLNLFPSIMQYLNIQFVDAKLGGYFKEIILDTIAVRTEKNIYRPDVINILKDIKNGLHNKIFEEKESEIDDGFATVTESAIGKANVQRKWNDNELVAQSFTFFFAGFDTSSTVLAFSTYEIAINKDIQQRLYLEILETHKKSLNGKITYEDLQKMKYMDMVISESLRKWPPIMMTDRLCSRNYEYKDEHRQFIIEKDQAVWIPIYGLHHDPKYFPNPSKFDPERFSQENKNNIVQGSYVPFGIGPRSCIGSRFALMEVKVIIFYLLLNFQFDTNENTQIPLKLSKSPSGVFSEKGIHLTFNKRQL